MAALSALSASLLAALSAAAASNTVALSAASVSSGCGGRIFGRGNRAWWIALEIYSGDIVVDQSILIVSSGVQFVRWNDMECEEEMKSPWTARDAL